MGEKGYTRDTQQCRVKIKLHPAYQKVREANSRSCAEPHTCWFYNELHAILRRDPTSTPTSNVDTAQVCESRDKKEDDMVDEEENWRLASGGSTLPQEPGYIFNLESCGSQDITVADSDAMEGTSGVSSTPESRLSLSRRRRKRTREDLFTEIMNASGTADTELKAWGISLSEKLDMNMESRKASNDQEHAAQDEMLQIMRDQANMLRCLIELQEQKQEGRVSLQTLMVSQPVSPGAESPFPKCSMRHG
ncbi:uncharacterized protein LOC119863544 [Dermochelys coriacea]|uniref:uncharacterized protein LOC119863544 n=1 Tax=Dermochelys coriacea TaxID=27794 RepID=UPI0018E81024|nr:uncharacterized protein LOC119863544 [Dermochelys coriacea]